MKRSSKRLRIGAAVVAIVAAAAVVVGLMSGGRRGDSRQAENQLQAGSVAIDGYIKSHGGVLPSFSDPDALQAALIPQLTGGDPAAWGRPKFNGETLSLPLLARPETGEPYAFNASLSGRRPDQFAHPESV